MWKRTSKMTYENLFSKKTSYYFMPETRAIDIDTELDWQFAEYLLKKSK